jgi:hypothetical protein
MIHSSQDAPDYQQSPYYKQEENESTNDTETIDRSKWIRIRSTSLKKEGTAKVLVSKPKTTCQI